jgi:hypothetical protein
MYVVIRKFRNMRSVHEAARRAKAGLAPILKQTPGFKAYYIFDGGNGVGGSVTLFESRESAMVASQSSLLWIKENLADLYEGDPELIAGEVVASARLSRRRGGTRLAAGPTLRASDWGP